MKKVILGKSGLEVSRIGMGVLPVGPSQLSLPVGEGAEVVRYALEKGINFLDTAQYYRTYPYIRKALAGGKYEPVISSKSLTPDYGPMTEAIEEARRDMDRDVIDIFLLHEVRSGDFGRRRGAWECLCDAKAKGLIRAIGISTHNVDVTDEISAVPECDVVFPLINYAGLGIRNGDGPGTAEDMLSAIERCHSAGMGVYAMKVFGGGNLTVTYQRAFEFAASRKSIDCMMIGFGAIGDVDDAVSFIEGRMPKGYNPDISKKRLRVEESCCEGCGSCIAACQSEAISFGSKGFAQIDKSRCITCGYCAAACPPRAIIMY